MIFLLVKFGAGVPAKKVKDRFTCEADKVKHLAFLEEKRREKQLKQVHDETKSVY